MKTNTLTAAVNNSGHSYTVPPGSEFKIQVLSIGSNKSALVYFDGVPAAYAKVASDTKQVLRYIPGIVAPPGTDITGGGNYDVLLYGKLYIAR